MKKITKRLFYLLFLALVTTGDSCTLIGLISDKKSMDLELSDLEKGLNNIIDLMIGGAAAVAIVFLIVGGVQYIGSLGNQEGAQKAKTTIINSIIGLIIILLAYLVIKIIANWLLKQSVI